MSAEKDQPVKVASDEGKNPLFDALIKEKLN